MHQAIQYINQGYIRFLIEETKQWGNERSNEETKTSHRKSLWEVVHFSGKTNCVFWYSDSKNIFETQRRFLQRLWRKANQLSYNPKNHYKNKSISTGLVGNQVFINKPFLIHKHLSIISKLISDLFQTSFWEIGSVGQDCFINYIFKLVTALLVNCHISSGN